MADKILLKPEDLEHQSIVLAELATQTEQQAIKLKENISLMNSSLTLSSFNLLFQEKKLENNTRDLASNLQIGANVAKNYAVIMKNTDAELAKEISLNDVMETEDSENWLKDWVDGNEKEKDEKSSYSMEDYQKHVTDAEYAKISGMWAKATEAGQTGDPKELFLEYAKGLPENDPLRNIDISKLEVYESPTGFSALIIHDKPGSAIVVFAATNKDVGDYISDGLLVIDSKVNPQVHEAMALIDLLTLKNCNNITVTGWSLGGYLATKVAINKRNVKKCVAFDPPGQGYTVGNIINKYAYRDKITTYVAKNSIVSLVGIQVGDVRKIDVEPNTSALLPNHGINEICDAIGGENAIAKSWEAADSSEGGWMPPPISIPVQDTGFDWTKLRI